MVAAPGYFAGRLSFGELMMVVGAFNQVQQSLRWFVDNTGSIADWRATLLRVMNFRQALLDLDAVEAGAGLIERREGPPDRLTLEAIRVETRHGCISLDTPRLDVGAGERVLILGKPGSGRTSFFLAIAGLWSAGSGRMPSSISAPPASWSPRRQPSAPTTRSSPTTAQVVDTIGPEVPWISAGLPPRHQRPDHRRHGILGIFEGPPEHTSCSSTRTGPASPRSPKLRAAERSGRPPHLDPLRQRRSFPARGATARRRRLDDRLRLPRDDGRRPAAWTAAGDHARAQDLFDAYLPLVRYEQPPGIGLAVRKYVLAKRGAINSAVQRRPAAGLHVEAVAEIEVLLESQGLRLKQIG